jgi:hypothetical protein
MGLISTHVRTIEESEPPPSQPGAEIGGFPIGSCRPRPTVLRMSGGRKKVLPRISLISAAIAPSVCCEIHPIMGKGEVQHEIDADVRAGHSQCDGCFCAISCSGQLGAELGSERRSCDPRRAVSQAPETAAPAFTGAFSLRGRVCPSACISRPWAQWARW